MDWKVGEIFEYSGEWYQCVVAIQGCRECSFRTQDYCTRYSECFSVVRSDGMSVIFKKLEKVGEPFYTGFYSSWVQKYKLYENNATGEYPKCHFGADYVLIEIKQNKDMEENTNVEQTPLEKLVIDFFNNRVTDIEFEKKVSELYAEHSNSEKIRENLKEFDLEAAKAGKPVCTRDGRKARIICFDAKGKMPIIALITNDKGDENLYRYHNSGSNFNFKGDSDLMMSPEKKEGWINVYALNTCYSSKEEAEANIDRDYEHEYVRTIKVNWEE